MKTMTFQQWLNYIAIRQAVTTELKTTQYHPPRHIKTDQICFRKIYLHDYE